jgi:hypothetical protein
MSKKIQAFTFKTNSQELIRNESVDGKDYIVVPTIAAKSMVMNGIFYPEEEFSNWLDTWEGIPIPVRHPKVNGQYVSARKIKIHEQYNIGSFYNVSFESGKLKGEMYLDKEKALKINKGSLIEKIENGEMIENSVCVFGELEEKSGEFEGVKYTHVISNMKPDHLALLEDEVGACSIKDGCGAMRVNCGENKECSCNKPKTEDSLTIVNLFKKLGSKLGFVNELSFDGVREKLMDSLNKGSGFFWVQDVYKEYFIYVDETESKIYRQSYSILNDVISLGEKEEVERKVEYVKITVNKGEDIVNKEEKVNKIIELKTNAFSSEDSEMLSKLDDVTLDKLLPNEEEVNEEVTPTEEAVEEVKSTEEKADEVVAGIEDVEVKELVQNSLNAYKAEKKQVLSDIVANSEYKEEELGSFNFEQLKKLSLLVNKKAPSPRTNHSGNGASAPISNASKQHEAYDISLLCKEEK